ncbi:hypothetical protein HYS90_01370 [Candidatus Curtissbacteria bacterium]|nr:hypothetical protein [Candidatus Curtissbacteria bacterium]
MAKIIPTILTANEDDYHDKLLLAEHVSDLIQVDIIDGMFADNTTVGVNVIKKYQSASMLEVQLMVLYPQNYIDELMFVEHVSRIIVPFEAHGDVANAIYHIRNHNRQVGLSINPQTPPKAALHFLDDIDFLLLLAVEPGFSGQKFKMETLDKVREVKKIAPGLAVEIDGGITFENAREVAASGADFLAVNSALFGAGDFYLAFEKLSKIVQN